MRSLRGSETPNRTIRLRHVSALGLAGLVSLGVASSSFAAVTPKKTTVPSLATLEKGLSSLENSAPTGQSVQETGSSLFFPLFQNWSSDYSAAKITAQSTGSGTGQAQAESGTVDIGASDAYLPPAAPGGVINIPEVVSAQAVNYNVPGVKVHLKLNASILQDMYNGTITNWNDPKIKKINPGVKLPSLAVVPLHRSDSSGDTFLFTSFLDFGLGGSAANPASGSSFVATAGGPNTGFTAWPNVSGALSASGNAGMQKLCIQTAGCVAYIGISYLRGALKGGLGYAELENGKGQYILPTSTSIADEVASFQQIPTNGSLSLIYSHSSKTGYPIVNFEYAIVKQSQSSSTKAATIKGLLAWGIDPRHGASSTLLTPYLFQPLAANAMAVALKELNSIS
jgi:phosphate transport system substrate-binding protein